MEKGISWFNRKLNLFFDFLYNELEKLMSVYYISIFYLTTYARY